MSKRKLLGYLMIVIFFIGLFCYVAAHTGIAAAAGIFAAALATTAFVVCAIFLIFW